MRRMARLTSVDIFGNYSDNSLMRCEQEDLEYNVSSYLFGSIYQLLIYESKHFCTYWRPLLIKLGMLFKLHIIKFTKIYFYKCWFYVG